ncbi:MAG: hypothetical protein ACYT04_37155 [Nostoc sp.]
MSNSNYPKVTFELIQRIDSLGEIETWDLKLQMTAFNREKLVERLTAIKDSIANYVDINPPDEAT